MSSSEREHRKEHREWNRKRDNHKLQREMPDIDLEVIENGFGFIWAMIPQHLAGEGSTLERYIRELFDLLMRTLPYPGEGDERSEIEGTPYGYDRWGLARVAEFIAHTNSIETARIFFRPIIDLGPAARYWVEDFLRSWTNFGIQATEDLQGFATIWQDIVAYAESLPAWQPPRGDYWSRAEGLSVHLMGLTEGVIQVIGQAKYKDLVASMAGTFERWGNRWLKFGSPAGWFAYFLRSESGQVLLAQGVKQLAGAVDSLTDHDWHHNDIGALFTEVLSLCWKHRQREVEKDADLRTAFLHILAVLCVRQIPEALHLRSKVSGILGGS